jgi:hypothetical protein
MNRSRVVRFFSGLSADKGADCTLSYRFPLTRQICRNGQGAEQSGYPSQQGFLWSPLSPYFGPQELSHAHYFIFPLALRRMMCDKEAELRTSLGEFGIAVKTVKTSSARVIKGVSWLPASGASERSRPLNLGPASNPTRLGE